MRIKVFTARDIDRALSMGEAVEVVKDAFVQLSLQKAQSPVRTSLTLKQPGEAALVMPAYIEESGALGAKMVTVLPCNPQSNLPAVQANRFPLRFGQRVSRGRPGGDPPYPVPHGSGHGRGHPGPLPAGFQVPGRLRSRRAGFLSGEGGSGGQENRTHQGLRSPSGKSGRDWSKRCERTLPAGGLNCSGPEPRARRSKGRM